jgi:hypothetical protein
MRALTHGTEAQKASGPRPDVIPSRLDELKLRGRNRSSAGEQPRWANPTSQLRQRLHEGSVAAKLASRGRLAYLGVPEIGVMPTRRSD